MSFYEPQLKAIASDNSNVDPGQATAAGVRICALRPRTLPVLL